MEWVDLLRLLSRALLIHCQFHFLKAYYSMGGNSLNTHALGACCVACLLGSLHSYALIFSFCKHLHGKGICESLTLVSCLLTVSSKFCSQLESELASTKRCFYWAEFPAWSLFAYFCDTLNNTLEWISHNLFLQK